jgi:YD repeat-containing protein
MMRRIAVVTLSLLGLTAVLSPRLALAAPIYSCDSVAIFAPFLSSILNPAQAGAPSCILAVGGALSLSGNLNAAVDLGTQAGTTTYTYEALGRLQTASGPVGTATITYDGLGRMSTATDPIGHTTTYHYESLNRLADSTDYLGDTTVYSYDGLDRLIRTVEEGGHVVDYHYDVGGRLSDHTDNLGKTTVYQYDGFDRLIRTTDNGTVVTQYTYAGNQLFEVTDPFNILTRYFYDANDNIVESVITPGGNVTTYTYNSLLVDQLDTIVDPTGVARSVYTAAAVVPEPGGLLLLAAGLAGLATVRRFRRGDSA